MPGKEHASSPEVRLRFRSVLSVRVGREETYANIDAIFARTEATNAMGECHSKVATNSQHLTRLADTKLVADILKNFFALVDHSVVEPHEAARRHTRAQIKVRLF